MFKVIMSTGWTTKDMCTGLNWNEAQEVCDGYGWVFCDGCFDWDLDIVEE